ncbi:MAG: flagellar basal-body rod protein FlgB [Alphaproteobacteria bacterium]|jgi:flagellar basal-body rod protein FlgB
MDLNKLPLFSLMSRRMSWLTERQNVLSQNIANADTPAFKPSDLSKESFRRMLEPERPRVSMGQTNASHIQPMRKPSAFRNTTDTETYGTALAGNAVELEEQLMKVSETQGAYKLATNLYRKHVSMFKAALGRDR